MTIATGDADWRAAGACMRADPELFFPISATGRALEQIAKAKAICAGCRVRQECLDFAHKHDVAHGIWGGTTRRTGSRPGGAHGAQTGNPDRCR